MRTLQSNRKLPVTSGTNYDFVEQTLCVLAKIDPHYNDIRQRNPLEDLTGGQTRYCRHEGLTERNSDAMLEMLKRLNKVQPREAYRSLTGIQAETHEDMCGFWLSFLKEAARRWLVLSLFGWLEEMAMSVSCEKYDQVSRLMIYLKEEKEFNPSLCRVIQKVVDTLADEIICRTYELIDANGGIIEYDDEHWEYPEGIEDNIGAIDHASGMRRVFASFVELQQAIERLSVPPTTSL